MQYMRFIWSLVSAEDMHIKSYGDCVSLHALHLCGCVLFCLRLLSQPIVGVVIKCEIGGESDGQGTFSEDYRTRPLSFYDVSTSAPQACVHRHAHTQHKSYSWLFHTCKVTSCWFYLRGQFVVFKVPFWVEICAP